MNTKGNAGVRRRGVEPPFIAAEMMATTKEQVQTAEVEDTLFNQLQIGHPFVFERLV